MTSPISTGTSKTPETLPINKFFKIMEHKGKFFKDHPDKELSSLDERYMSQEYGDEKHPFSSESPIKYSSYSSSDNEANGGFLRNSGGIGKIILPSGREIELQSKSKTRPFEMLEYARGISCNDKKRLLYYDIDHNPNIEGGTVFYDALGEAFLRELERVRKHELVREYVERVENSNYLKGKLLISKHIRSNFVSPRFFIRYFDLTIDNLPNQMILYSAIQLLRFVSKDLKDLLRNLSRSIEFLRGHVTLLPVITPILAKSVKIPKKKNKYYTELIELSKMIISSSYYGSESTAPLGFNYLLDQKVVFERAVFKLLTQVFKGIDDRYELTDQQKYPINKIFYIPRKKFGIVPDIRIFDNVEKTEIAVLDAKYKPTISRDDYFQILIFSLFLRLKAMQISKEKGNLFKRAFIVNYTDDEESDKVTINKFHDNNLPGSINLGQFMECDDILIYTITLNINKWRMEDFEDDLKDEIVKILNGP